MLPSVLAVLAHPDDEAIVCGGVLAQHAEAGARTGVATATWASDSPRAGELADSLAALGVGEAPRMLGYADHRVPESAPGRARWCDVPLDEAVAVLVSHIREVRPEIVITHDAYGQLTGHPDHRHTHQMTMLAVTAAGLGQLYPEAGEPWRPSALYLATHPHSGVGELGALLRRVGKSVLSVPDEHITATVDVRPWLGRKWAAITAHRSQVERERPLPGILFRLPEEDRHRIIGTEYYTRLSLIPSPAHQKALRDRKEMTTTSAPDEHPSVAMTEEAYGALRASAALWAGTSVLITNQRGQVLIQRVSYRPTCLLPGGAVDVGESPAQGAARELEEELGVTASLTRGLAVDWVSPVGRTAAPAMKFPGELLHVFDGGVWDEDQIAAIRPAPGEIEAVEFVEPAELPALMAPGDARRALSALRARIAGIGPALLEDGLPIAPTVLDRVGVLHTARGCHHFPFHPHPVPDGLTVRQSWVWAFAPDGRVLVLLEPDTGAACLPGGTPELADHADPAATLIREAREEAAAELAGARYIGYLSDPHEPWARVRYAASLASLGPAPVDPATGRIYVRILATPEQALGLFDWGPPAAEQLQAVHQARVLLGIPEAAHQPVTELSAPITW